MTRVLDLGRVYAHLIAAQVRAQTTYRSSFLLELVVSGVITSIEILTIVLFFTVTPTLGGFTVQQALLIAALANLSFSLADLTFGNLEQVSKYVRTGQLDSVLIRPLGVIGQLASTNLEMRILGRVLQSVILLIIALAINTVEWTPARVVLVVVAPLAGAVMFGSIFVLGGAVTFWLVEARELGSAFTYGGRELTAYPIGVYGKWFRRIFAYAIPFAFVAYYPALVLLGRPDPLGMPTWIGYACPLTATAVALVAAACWRAGVRHYRGTGS